MKKIRLTLFALLFVQAFVVFAQDEESPQPPGPYMVFEEDKHDFGDIVQGDKVEHVFTFENTGDAPLLITNIKVTCGCTATNWSRDPILPGETSSITVSFNSAGKLNKQNKVITIVSNAANPLPRVTITANVKPKETDSK